jgi:hypothetical protein
MTSELSWLGQCNKVCLLVIVMEARGPIVTLAKLKSTRPLLVALDLPPLQHQNITTHPNLPTFALALTTSKMAGNWMSGRKMGLGEAYSRADENAEVKPQPQFTTRWAERAAMRVRSASNSSTDVAGAMESRIPRSTAYSPGSSLVKSSPPKSLKGAYARAEAEEQAKIDARLARERAEMERADRSSQREKRVLRRTYWRRAKACRGSGSQQSMRASLPVQEQRVRVQRRVQQLVQHTWNMQGQAAQEVAAAALGEAISTTHHGIQPRRRNGRTQNPQHGESRRA